MPLHSSHLWVHEPQHGLPETCAAVYAKHCNKSGWWRLHKSYLMWPLHSHDAVEMFGPLLAAGSDWPTEETVVWSPVKQIKMQRCKPSSNCFCFAAMSIYINTYIFIRIDFQEVSGRQRMAPKRNSTVKDLWPCLVSMVSRIWVRHSICSDRSVLQKTVAAFSVSACYPSRCTCSASGFSCHRRNTCAVGWWHRTCGPNQEMCYFAVPLHSSRHWVHAPQHGSPDRGTCPVKNSL